MVKHTDTVGLLITGGFVAMVMAQTISISGTLIDSVTSLPLANAVVSVVEFPGISDTSDSHGSFALGGTTQASLVQHSSADEFTARLHGGTLTISGVNHSDATEVAVYNPAGAKVDIRIKST